MCKTCGEHQQFAFETLDEATMVAAARAAHQEGEAWHFHVLAPGCTFSPDKRVYTFLLELIDQDRAICCFFDSKPVAVNKELLALLHGADALSDKGTTAGDIAGADGQLLDRTGVAAAAGKRWHHHMMFPACKLNQSAGKWRIFVEIEGEDVIVRDYDEEPSLVLNRIERLYFGLS